MNDQRPTLEVIAPSIEEAVAKGLSDLGLTEDDVEIEVLDEGNRGLFGLGTRQARIRITVMGELDSQQSIPASPITVTSESKEGILDNGEQSATPYGSLATEAVEETGQITQASKSIQDDITLHVAQETVTELLERMKITAEVSAFFGEKDEFRGRIPIHVDITGNDLSILIGRQAETLNAIQYIAGLIVGKELGRSITLIIDVEGYRQRREQQIRQLARRMADQAIQTNRRQVLEPMPANERRFVHIELRNDSKVTTESIGEDPYRKVTITPVE